jgi:signal transduction histidine kinase
MTAGSAVRSADDPQGRPTGVGAELISHTGHALRACLNAILGYAQILELDRANPLTPVQKERVDQIQASGWQLLRLIDDALELARIGAGQLAVSMGPVALAPLLRNSLTQLDEPAASSRVGLDAASHDAIVWADPARLRQVVVKLLLGALKCDRHGGSVLLGLGQSAEGGAMIRIRGDGLALAPGQLEKMFLPLDHPAAKDGPAEGIQVGLVLAQKLVELMGGQLQVHRDPASGSELRVLLRGHAAGGGPPSAADA